MPYWSEDFRKAWNQAKAEGRRYAVLDLRTNEEVASNDLNNHQRFVTMEQVLADVHLEILSGQSDHSAGGGEDLAQAGYRGFSLLGGIIHGGPSQVFGHVLDMNTFDYTRAIGIANAFCWPGTTAAGPEWTVTPDWAYNARHIVGAYKEPAENKEFAMTYSNEGGYIGSDLRGPFAMWNLFPTPTGWFSTGVRYMGAWGGTNHVAWHAVWGYIPSYVPPNGGNGGNGGYEGTWRVEIVDENGVSRFYMPLVKIEPSGVWRMRVSNKEDGTVIGYSTLYPEE